MATTPKQPLVIITGASGSLGMALIARHLRAGHRVIDLTSKAWSKYEKSRSFENADRLDFITCDITQKASLLDAIHRIKGSAIRYLIMCHGGTDGVSTDPMAISSHVEHLMNLNLYSNIYFIEGLLETLVSNNAVICFISSISGIENHGVPSYSAAKSALIAYSRSIGRHLSRMGVSVFTVSPGAFEGEQRGYWFEMKQKDPARFEAFVSERMSIGRLGTVDEVSDFIFQVCMTATPYMAGTNLVIDGGQGKGFYGMP